MPVRVWVLGVEGFSVSEGKVSGILGVFRAFGSLVVTGALFRLWVYGVHGVGFGAV